MRAVPPTPWTPGGSGANDEGQHRRHPPLPDVRGRRVRARARARRPRPCPRPRLPRSGAGGRGRALQDGLRAPLPAAGSAAHGPDAAPHGRDVRRPRPLSELAAATVAAPAGPRRPPPLCGASATVFPATASRPSTPTPRTGPTATTRSRPSSGSGPASSTRRSTTARPRPRRAPRPLRDRPGLRARRGEGGSLSGRDRKPQRHGRRAGGAGFRPPGSQVPRLGGRLRVLRPGHGEAGRQAVPGQREQRGRAAGHGRASRSRLLGRRQPFHRGARARAPARRGAASALERQRQFPLHRRRRGLCYDDDGVLDGLVWAHGRQVRLGPSARPTTSACSTAVTTTTSTPTRRPGATSPRTGTWRRAAS